MDIKHKTMVIDAAVDELRGLLNEHIDTIDQSMQSMLAEHQKESEFKYKVGLGLSLVPRPDTTKVSASISYSVRHSDETAGYDVDPNQTVMDLD